ncbi:MAG: hypothetical protein WB630_18165, partial [Candidatus Acidiferrales bacterium]
VFIQTLGCGIERITDLDKSQPQSQLVYTFPGNWCGVPTIVGHYLIQSVPATNGLIVLDISNAVKPVETSRIKLTDTYAPHWTAWGEKTQRLVVTSSGSPVDHRLFLLKLDQESGAITLDDAFRDSDGKAGFNFEDREWPQGWKGTGAPHGAVFSR